MSGEPVRAVRRAHAPEIGTAQDHKRAFDGDLGLNTGGMGACSPAPRLDAATVERAMAEIVRPTLAGWRRRGRVRRHSLRRADAVRVGAEAGRVQRPARRPERQAVLPRLMTDLAQLLLGAVDGMLAEPALAARRARVDGGAGERGLPRRLCQGHRDPWPRRAGGRSRPARVPRRHAAGGGRPAARRRRTGARRDRNGGDTGEARTGPTRRWTGSTGRKASAGATSAGGRRAESPGPVCGRQSQAQARPRRGRRRGGSLQPAPRASVLVPAAELTRLADEPAGRPTWHGRWRVPPATPFAVAGGLERRLERRRGALDIAVAQLAVEGRAQGVRWRSRRAGPRRRGRGRGR